VFEHGYLLGLTVGVVDGLSLSMIMFSSELSANEI
jgi:hypothetical protein